jgi:DNA (cytosine-5)-methyltransferase 3A
MSVLERSDFLRVLSLFDGISCGMVALERAEIPVERYVAYEIEEDAIKVSKHNYPQIEHKGDVFKAVYAEGEFDLLIGGSPCTYWSIAKAGYGRETTSSGMGFELFMQYVRALREAKPKYFLYENNESMSDSIKEEITKQLGVEPLLIDSADFSAQHRKRLYWTNIPVTMGWTKSDLLFEDIMEKEGNFKYRDFSKFADTVKISKDGLSVRYDTSGKGQYGQGNRAKKPNQKWNTLPSAGSNTKNDIWVDDYIGRHLLPVEMERLQTLPDGYTSCLNSDIKTMRTVGNGWTVDVIAHILKSLKETR